jgi:hypothetical protein
MKRRAGRWALAAALSAGVLAVAGCRDIGHDLYPHSRVIISRRYSATRWETAGSHADSLATISQWYDTHFAGSALLDRHDEPALQTRRWRLPDRIVEVFIVDHGNMRSIYVCETSRLQKRRPDRALPRQ